MTDQEPLSITTSIDLVIEARWLVPVDSSHSLREFYSVVIHHQVIVDILPTIDARVKYMPSELVVLGEHVLIPGLINAHTHIAMSLMRGMADDLPLMTWLNDHIWPAERAVISEQFVRDSSLLGCAEMLSGGITCFNDMYFFPQATAMAVNQAGMRANLGLAVLEFATSYASDADDYLRKGFEAHDSWRGNALISSSIAPHAPYTVSNQTFEKIITYAEQLGLGIHTHLHETRDEISQSESQYGMRPIQRLTELGLLGPTFVAAHGVHLLAHEIDVLTEYGCHIAHCPSSNLKLASGIAPIALLLKNGVNVGLGTDGAASNNRLDMFAEMRLAALLAKGVSEDPSTLPAHQALEMATINAAKALGLEDIIGSIEVGKQADLAAVKLSDFNTSPCYDPISHLVYSCGREHVTHTWVAGELRYSNGVYANIEPIELKEIVQTWQPKLRQYKH
ncbi:MAG: TRZ/ATZ family hydrolase [Methylotenera sp.]|nr:TRZ/ATZ family hydrolase [Methylotenera sp.]MDO9232784.1 TRZ/ATZ family hydrolase [Methylotenera sp.]MDO9389705.1 TRZ/ATZ family hydrolase [Methylotenera sp.]MDP2102034.1 TRZ/ATZ family hydrolase [Methylotenera sp.]MDP2281318.1 TRZ/ATZ family hydrolase [Methylotenera sp.]